MALLIAIFLVLPSLNWSAIRKPGQMENKLAGYIASGWIRHNAKTQSNSLPPTPENLKAGQMISMNTARVATVSTAAAKIGSKPTSIPQSRN